MMKKCAGLFLLVLLISSCAPSGLKSFQEAAIGVWEVEGDTIEITKNSIKFPYEESIEYRFDDSKIYLSLDGETINCRYTLIDKNSFSVLFEGETVIFKKSDKNNFSMYFEDEDDEISFSKILETDKTSKSSSSLSGVYKSTGEALLASIEFERDGTCYTVDSIMGLRQAMRYEVKGDKVIISAGRDTQPCFKVVNQNTIEGITIGFYGTYVKR